MLDLMLKIHAFQLELLQNIYNNNNNNVQHYAPFKIIVPICLAACPRALGDAFCAFRPIIARPDLYRGVLS